MSTLAVESAPQFSYKWSIPSISTAQTKLLCFGYVRQIRKNNRIIPQPVTDLCASYFTPNDPYTLDQLHKASKRELVLSPAFEMNNVTFAVGMYPNGYYSKTQGLILPVLRRLSSNTKFSLISAYFTLQITLYLKSSAATKTYTVTEYCYDFTGNDLFFSDKGPMHDHIRKSYLKNCERMTVDLKFQFVDLDDRSGKSYISKTQRKMNELVKQNKILKIENGELEQKLEKTAKLSVKIRDKRKTKEMKDWLTNVVELPEYYKVFVANGIMDLFTVKLVTMDTLDDIKMQKIGHKLKIMHFVNELNNVNGSNKNKRAFEEVTNDDSNNHRSPPSKRQRTH